MSSNTKTTCRRGKTVARIIDMPSGYGISDDALDYLDERGPKYPTRRAAIAAARDAGYTHYLDDRGHVRKF